MIDVTQSMACIQCGACVSACLSMEMDPDFIGPAALAKAYRFVGDPRDAQSEERLHDLANDPHGIYDCTHCFVHRRVPEGVAPMDQIMRLRRAAGDERDRGCEQRPAPRGRVREDHRVEGHPGRILLLQESFAPGVKGKLNPRAARSRAAGVDPDGDPRIRSGKMRSLPKLIPGIHPKPPGDAQDQVKRIYAHAEEHSIELNLYIKGEEDGTRRSRGTDPEAYPPRPSRTNRRFRRDRDAESKGRPRARPARASGKPGQEGGLMGPQVRVLARLRLARVHHRAARLDGAGLRAAGIELVELTAPTAAAPG